MDDNSCLDITSSTQEDYFQFGEKWSAEIDIHYLSTNVSTMPEVLNDFCSTELDINQGITDYPFEQDTSRSSSVSGLENTMINPKDILSIDGSQCPDLINAIMNNNDELEIQHSQFERTIPAINIVNGLSSLPASENWPGRFNFNIHFKSSDERKKGISWLYVDDKLYVDKDKPCPINFVTSCRVPSGVQIRATALFSSPDSATEVVERCVNHTNEDRNQNVSNPEHLIRCESPLAKYEIDPISRRYSVVVPYENPPVGQNYSTYIYKFTCFGSCPGQKRKPLMLMFSLEENGFVIGRSKVDLKVCACPLRDSQANSSSSSNGCKSKKRKIKREQDESDSSFDVTYQPKRKKMEDNEENERYTIEVNDRKCYEFLQQMKNYFEIMNTVKNMPPNVKNFLKDYNIRKGYNINLD